MMSSFLIEYYLLRTSSFVYLNVCIYMQSPPKVDKKVAQGSLFSDDDDDDEGDDMGWLKS